MMAAGLPLDGHTDIPPITDKFGWQHYLTHKDRGLLSEQYPERLFDISDSPKEITYLLDMSDTAQNSPRPVGAFAIGARQTGTVSPASGSTQPKMARFG